MPQGTFLKVFVETENGTEAFLSGIHPDFGNQVVCVAYDGQQVKLIKIFTVRLQSSGDHTPIYPTALEKFVRRLEYYLMTKGNIYSVALKKKKVIKVLGYDAEIEQYTKEHNLSLKKEVELVQLLKYYEANIIQELD